MLQDRLNEISEAARDVQNQVGVIAAKAQTAISEIPPPCEDPTHHHEPEGDPPIERHPRMADLGRQGTVLMLSDLEKDPEKNVGQLAQFQWHPDPVEDIQGRPEDGVKGWSRIAPGDRWRYAAAWLLVEHLDPRRADGSGGHGWLEVLRFFLLNRGHRSQVNDLGLPENPLVAGVPVQGLPPYPYEGANIAPPPVLRDHRGGLIQLFHQRGFDADLRFKGKGKQLLWEFQVPEVGTIFRVKRGEDPRPIEGVDIWYQGAGVWLLEHVDLGVFGELIVAGMNLRYTFEVGGFADDSGEDDSDTEGPDS